MLDGMWRHAELASKVFSFTDLCDAHILLDLKAKYSKG